MNNVYLTFQMSFEQLMSTNEMKPTRLGTGARLFPPHVEKSARTAAAAMFHKDVGDNRFEKRTTEVIRTSDLTNILTFHFSAPEYVLYDLSNLWLELGLQLIDESKTDNIGKVADGAKMCPINNVCENCTLLSTFNHCFLPSQILHSVIGYVEVRVFVYRKCTM